MAEKSQDFFEDTDGIDMDIKIVLALGIQEYACLAYGSPQFQLPAHESKQLIILEDSERKEKRRECLQFFQRVHISSLEESWWKHECCSTCWGGNRWKQEQATDREELILGITQQRPLLNCVWKVESVILETGYLARKIFK